MNTKERPHSADQKERLDQVRGRVATGLAELDKGEGIDGEEFLTSLIERLEAQAADK